MRREKRVGEKMEMRDGGDTEETSRSKMDWCVSPANCNTRQNNHVWSDPPPVVFQSLRSYQNWSQPFWIKLESPPGADAPQSALWKICSQSIFEGSCHKLREADRVRQEVWDGTARIKKNKISFYLWKHGARSTCSNRHVPKFSHGHVASYPGIPGPLWV